MNIKNFLDYDPVTGIFIWKYRINGPAKWNTKWAGKVAKENNAWKNLRLANKSQNAVNSKLRKDNSSGYKGVSKAATKWRARIAKDGQQFLLGHFSSPEEAYAAYIDAAKRLHGEYARVI